MLFSSLSDSYCAARIGLRSSELGSWFYNYINQTHFLKQTTHKSPVHGANTHAVGTFEAGEGPKALPVRPLLPAPASLEPTLGPRSAPGSPSRAWNTSVLMGSLKTAGD